GLARPAAHETLLLCGRVVGTEVGIPLVRLSPLFSWTRGSWSTSDCRHGPSSARLNVSASASRAKSPRRLTHGPRLVETVTSGEAVTRRRASSPSLLPISLRRRPNPVWVDSEA